MREIRRPFHRVEGVPVFILLIYFGYLSLEILDVNILALKILVRPGIYLLVVSLNIQVLSPIYRMFDLTIFKNNYKRFETEISWLSLNFCSYFRISNRSLTLITRTNQRIFER